MRDGAFVSQVPTVVSRVSSPPEPWCYKEFLAAQSSSSVPIKYTLPGPMTIMDGCYNRHYEDSRELAADIIRTRPTPAAQVTSKHGRYSRSYSASSSVYERKSSFF